MTSSRRPRSRPRSVTDELVTPSRSSATTAKRQTKPKPKTKTKAKTPTQRKSQAIADPLAEEMPEIGTNLRQLRADQGLTLDRLAQMAGVSRAMLGQIELGQSTPTIKTLWKISRALELPFSALISGSSSGGTT